LGAFGLCNMTASGAAADPSIAFIESRSMSVNHRPSSNDLQKINGSMHCFSKPVKRARFTAEMSSVLFPSLVKRSRAHQTVRWRGRAVVSEASEHDMELGWYPVTFLSHASEETTPKSNMACKRGDSVARGIGGSFGGARVETDR
jgi:hypothetical protein